MISVVIIGAGNVATHLFKAFNTAEQVLVAQWYSRKPEALKAFGKSVETTSDLSQLKQADVYILAVSDDAVSSVSAQLPFENRLVVHTSGSANIRDIDKKHNIGVFYPLQSFSKKAKLNFKDVPICIEAIKSTDYHTLKTLAQAIGSPTKKVNSDQRAVLHLAAVYINNFTNQLYRIAHEITESEGAEFDLLKPLILETAKKVQELSPYQAQTGPALRNDKKTIKKHLALLNNNTEHKAIYKLLTQSIQRTHGRKKL